MWFDAGCFYPHPSDLLHTSEHTAMCYVISVIYYGSLLDVCYGTFHNILAEILKILTISHLFFHNDTKP